MVGSTSHTIPLSQSLELERFLCGVIHKGARSEYGYRIDGWRGEYVSYLLCIMIDT